MFIAPTPGRFPVVNRMGLGMEVTVNGGAEGEAALTAVAEKVGRIELTGEAVWRPNNAIHALDRRQRQ